MTIVPFTRPEPPAAVWTLVECIKFQPNGTIQILVLWNPETGARKAYYLPERFRDWGPYIYGLPPDDAELKYFVAWRASLFLDMATDIWATTSTLIVDRENPRVLRCRVIPEETFGMDSFFSILVNSSLITGGIITEYIQHDDFD
jgi:hypothetical protein